MKTKKLKTFVEIGCCDFDTLIPLSENGWQGYCIEPIKEYADKLSHKNVTVSNCAISSYDGQMEMYVSQGNGWSKGISHAVKQKGTKLLELSPNKHLLKEKRVVYCCTLDSYLKKYNITQIDFMKVDVEGHENDIFESYQWTVKPTFMKIEHAHIDDLLLKDILEKQGYMCYTERNDMYAIR